MKSIVIIFAAITLFIIYNIHNNDITNFYEEKHMVIK